MKKLLICFLFSFSMILYGQQLINVGSSPNDKTGDPLRTAFQKVNINTLATYDSLKLKAALLRPHFTGPVTISGGNLNIGTNSLTMTGSLAATGSRVLKGWFTDLEVTNAIAGSITGNAETVTGFNRGTYGANLTLSTADSYTLTLTMGAGDQNFTFPAVASGTFAISSGAQTFTGIQTFSSTISGNISGNAGTVTGYTPASGSLTLSGADAITVTTTAATSVTLPTSGTLATTTDAALGKVYSDTMSVSAGVLRTKATTLTTEPYSVQIFTSGGKDITHAVSDSVALNGGVYKLYVYSVDALSGCKLKILY
jgi:hypothetical protein